jgi:predicted AAA+ superfamily ATPase
MFPREITPKLREALEEDPVVFLRGPRQAGKTTLAGSLTDGRQYHTLDDLATLAAAKSDPEAFVAGLADRVVIDEVQRVPELLLAIKRRVDQERVPGRFLLTGSSEIRARGAVAESLAGRMRMLDLLPLSQSEIAGGTGAWLDALWDGTLAKAGTKGWEKPELLNGILRGGFPEAVTRKTSAGAQRWLRAYADALIERDMTDLARIGDVAQMSRLLSLFGSRTAAVANYADFARVLGVPLTTVRRYLALAQAVFFSFELPAWAGNTTARLVRQPKLHLCDTGIACVLAGLDGKTIEAQPILLGQIFETFVVTEVRKAVAWSPRDLRLSHFRSHAGREVDLVIEARDGTLCGLEMKLGSTVRAGDFAGLRHLQETVGPKFRQGYVVHGGDRFVSFAPNLHALPVAALRGIF